jgi:hypothetical protein
MRVGQLVRITDADHPFHGCTGEVERDGGDGLHVLLTSTWQWQWLEPWQVELVDTEPQTAAAARQRGRR